MDSTEIDNILVSLYNTKRTKNVIKRTEPKKQEPLIDEKTGKKIRRKQKPLNKYFNGHNKFGKILIEAGVDEAGRGPLFGRVYTACVILPVSDDSYFDHSKLKDSKKYSSKKKLMEIYNYIKEYALAYSVCYEDEDTIDKINIRQATLKCMNRCINEVITKLKPDYLLIDGCDFYNSTDIPYICIEGGDNLYTPIAAASILAKVERDLYIEELCKENQFLDDYYGLTKNKGYGTKQHIDGIKEHGISLWHRKTFGICKKYS